MMRRVKTFFHVAFWVVSVVLGISCVVLWVRSYSGRDSISYQITRPPGSLNRREIWLAQTTEGELQFSYLNSVLAAEGRAKDGWHVVRRPPMSDLPFVGKLPDWEAPGLRYAEPTFDNEFATVGISFWYPVVIVMAFPSVVLIRRAIVRWLARRRTRAVERMPGASPA